MRSVVIIRSYPQGPRCWIMGQRVHHGAVGLLAAALLHKRRRLAAATLLLVAHDAHDWRIWFTRERVPAGTRLDKPMPAP